ncbi:hypothetical protein GGR57DRAFT_478399 [Xylariaceae sp. FL1272]|nr:hypothetical protein GGR57DRAFT_478399 [Xylariaceae sp. FL1272]
MSGHINNIRIRSWIQTVQSAETPSIERNESQVSGRPTKRLRFSEKVDGTFPTVPDTPPSIDDPCIPRAASPRAPRTDTECHREMSDNKRPVGDDEIGDEGVNIDSEKTPKPWKILLPYSKRLRSRSASPKKSRTGLHLLEKPIATITEAVHESLHRDIQSLYLDIQNAVEFKQVILPSDLPALTTTLGRKPPPSCFRDPDPEDENAIPRAIATHDGLCRIHRAAVKSALCQRHEPGWNNLVHTPLLDLVFRSDNGTNKELSDTVVAEFEPLMAATIAGDSIPRYAGAGLACSVSTSSAGESSERTDSKVEDVVDLTQVHSSSNSKKVDYALVLHLPDGSDLLNLVRDLAKEVAIRNGVTAPHINQSTYTPIAYAPIAVSIETKTPFSPDDPLVQLGLWTAAWHKRMEHLRSHLSWSGVDGKEEQLLVSLPLIQVVGHQWHVYFACDEGKSIKMYGPVSLGSTESLMSIYALFTSLQAIKVWIETEFYDGMKAWFGV